ncbi:MAG: Carbamoyl-phosphate synthase large chain [Promethearchaeota archaeon]|nr:MAG: Carbamoyl-phosphate synthase large chain [Candidatus Lokiarchaeota archaeon]
MAGKKQKVLVLGFNSRPLVYSLYQAGYEVFAVDFFGDVDLYPYVKDSVIITEKLGSSYGLLKDKFSSYLIDFTIELLEAYKDIDYLIIGSGLDDAFRERKALMKSIKRIGYSIISANNTIDIIKKARNIDFLFNLLHAKRYKTPKTYNLGEYINQSPPKPPELSFPLILKKKKSSGGLNVSKINSLRQLDLEIEILKSTQKNELTQWFFQEFLKGIPVSCTTISNGSESKIISTNRQIIGLDFVNAPHNFMYCGNIVPARLLEKDINLIEEISLYLANKLGLKGINGFDFVLRDHYPYLMEINPRIPGSIRASEEVLNLNLLDMHIQSFLPVCWKIIEKKLQSIHPNTYCTKLIFYAPNDLSAKQINAINQLEFVHDKSDPKTLISKREPVCTILYEDSTFSNSFFGALKIADKIKDIIKK